MKNSQSFFFLFHDSKRKKVGKKFCLQEIIKNKCLTVITAKKVFIFLSKNVWFFETSDDDDDGVDAFLLYALSPKFGNGKFD